MLRDDYECLGIAVNMITVIELTHFFTCDGVTDINRKGMTFLKIIREKGNLTFRVMQICIPLLWNV